MIIELRRNQEGSNKTQTISKFQIIDEWNCVVLEGYILELPDRDNAFQVSRIPEGVYDCVKRNSEKYNDHFHVLNVLDRDYILIHHGNFYYNTRGCLLPGDNIVDINNDGNLDVVNSRATMERMNEILPNEFQLVIIN
tara:strand:+ start:7755 stop:8168 length:414 start_codon:yes stop_codon:yes gene_type:complete